MIKRTSGSARDRRAMILMVVLALLTLFTILGITFVYISDSYMASAKWAREAENFTTPNVDPELAGAFVLGQLLYDTNDDALGIFSALRGQSLGRNMCGFNDDQPSNGVTYLNDKAYQGLGRLRYPIKLPNGTATLNHQLVNFQYFPNDKFIRDPERIYAKGYRVPNVNSPGRAVGTGSYVAGNVPYTYPDENCFFLAYFDPDQNKVVIPSFHRPWLFGSLDPANMGANPNWTNVVGKYLTLCPRPQEHPKFPPPTDAGGHVKNLDGAAGGCDSIWIDPNGPVMIAPNGVKYKMMVAPLIMEMDSRINLNVHGNILGLNSAHAGNQGIGPYEVNISKVLNLATSPTEWQNVFLGSPPTGGAPTVWGRYGSGRLPSSSVPVLAGKMPRGWAQVDMNGTQDPAPGAATGPWSLPTATNNPTSGFLTFPMGYGNGVPVDINDKNGNPIHPMIYNWARPSLGSNRNFSASDLASLLRYKGTNAEFLQSDLLRLCPNNLANDAIRNSVTLLGSDLDRPAPIPYVWDYTAPAYTMTGNYFSRKFGRQGAISKPFDITLLGDRLAPMANQTKGEFDYATWRSEVLSALPQVNLDRPLRDYPIPDKATGLIDMKKYSLDFTNAQSDRQLFAGELFNALQKAVGARQVSQVTSGSAEWNALRFLAQVAVNIVDFIDQDDISTPFNWDTVSANKEWVFGVELPRLVINEAYVQYDNDPLDTGFLANVLKKKATTFYNVNVWVELLNPLNGATDPLYSGGDPKGYNLEARLHNSVDPVYQVVIADSKTTTNILQDPANTTGDVNNFNNAKLVRATGDDFGPNSPKVLPVGTNYGTGAPGPGFFVLGPKGGTPLLPFNEDPKLPMSFSSPKMTYKITPVNDPNSDTVPQPTILLRRLACPGLPFQPNPGANYNPYITVDYVSSVPGNDARNFNSIGDNTLPGTTYLKMPLREAYGRREPYDATVQLNQQPIKLGAGQPHNTFFRHNGKDSKAALVPPLKDTLTVPFNSLVHLDRQLISKAELMYASCCMPHDLTQKFVQGGIANQHSAPWQDETSGLYRFLDFAYGPTRVAGSSYGGRTSGKININMLFPPAAPQATPSVGQSIFRAVCDAQPGNLFTEPKQVDPAFTALTGYRSPNGTPAQDDSPFWGFGTGLAPGKDQFTAGSRGIHNILNLSATPLIPPQYTTSTNPYQRGEMLNKLMNNFTTRSNVYAIWLTVGFFEVVNSPSSGFFAGNTGTDFSTPPQLGAEIGKSENRNVRHRLFAIVDRTNMQVFSTTSTQKIAVARDTTGIITGPASPTLTLPATFTDARTGRQYQLVAGNVLVYEPNTDNEEAVVVTPDPNNPGQFVATFWRDHPNPCTVISRGNPGPWTQQPYDPRKDSGVVLYFAVID